MLFRPYGATAYELWILHSSLFTLNLILCASVLK